MSVIFWILMTFILGYLLGSLSSAILLCRILGLPDPRTEGSGNPGATNVMRIAGKKVAYLVFVGDCLKGLIPVLLVSFFSDNDVLILAAALGAFIGHLYPIYFKFKGGKGVATLVGILIGINPWLFLAFGVVWIAVLFLSGFSSLSSILGSVSTVVVAYLIHESNAVIALLVILSVLIIYRHRSNIERILKGEELHFRSKSKRPDSK